MTTQGEVSVVTFILSYYLWQVTYNFRAGDCRTQSAVSLFKMETTQCRSSGHQVCWYHTTIELSKIVGIFLIKLLLKNENVPSVTWNCTPTYYKN